MFIYVHYLSINVEALKERGREGKDSKEMRRNEGRWCWRRGEAVTADVGSECMCSVDEVEARQK